MRPTRGSAVLAAAALLLTVAQLLWTVFLLNGSSDGPAFAVGLVGTTAMPACLVLSVLLTLDSASASTRAAATVLTALGGLAAAGVGAGFFIADDPADPAWIGAVAVSTPFVAGAAGIVAGTLSWRLLRGMRGWRRAAVVLPLAVVAPLAVGFVVTQTPSLWLAALALPVVLAVLRSRERGRRRPAQVPAASSAVRVDLSPRRRTRSHRPR